jgi:hypothetical protein
VRRGNSVVIGALGVGALVLLLGHAPRVAASGLPARLSDVAFWQMVTEFSETGGSFPSHNFVSNETAFQRVVPRLKASIAPGGVYIGVGPDQNFTYITALRPRLAFIVDIRRQNMLHHLLYKALIELAPSRVEFLSRLFSRPRPPDLGDASTADELTSGFARMAPTDELFNAHVREVREHLVTRRKFPLSEDDLSTIAFVHRAFFDGGPHLTYSGVVFWSPAPGDVPTRVASLGPYPTYQELMTETDGAGTNHSYLASEDRYRVLRDFQLANLIVPIIGDFAGEKALRAVGAYVKQQGGVVTTFYASNVEQYLFQNGIWRRFYANVAALPFDSSSTFVRAFFPNRSIQAVIRPMPPPSPQPDGRLPTTTLLGSVAELLAAHAKNAIAEYADVINMSK